MVKRLPPLVKKVPITGHEDKKILLPIFVTLASLTEGAFVEVGVFTGFSIKIISKQLKILGDKRIVFGVDTFKGVTKLKGIDLSPYQRKYKEKIKSFFSMSKEFKEETIRKLEALGNIKIIEGKIEDVAPKYFANRKFAFVHLDVDLYETTKFCIQFFWPRLSKGGIMMIHDYNHAEGKWPGIPLVVHEHFKDEQILTYGSYAIIIKGN